MNIVVWIFQGLLAAMFLMVGSMKLTTPKAKLEEKIPLMKNYPAGMAKFIGTAEVLGALGLILPMLLNVVPILTPVAASALALVMVLGAGAHAQHKEYKPIAMNVLLFAMALVVAIYRF